MMYVQAELRRDNYVYVAWIEKRKGLRVGSRVTLLPENTVWVVEALYTEMDKVHLDGMNAMNGVFGASLRKNKA